MEKQTIVGSAFGACANSNITHTNNPVLGRDSSLFGSQKVDLNCDSNFMKMTYQERASQAKGMYHCIMFNTNRNKA